MCIYMILFIYQTDMGMLIDNIWMNILHKNSYYEARMK